MPLCIEGRNIIGSKTYLRKGAGGRVRVQSCDHLVLATAKPGAATFRCMMIHDPRYQEPLVGVTHRPVSAYAL